MDNLKTYLIFGLLIVSLLLWQAWQTDYVQPQKVAQKSEQVADIANSANTKQSNNQQELPELPATASSLEDLASTDQATGVSSTSNKIHVKTDVMDLYISTQGADIHNLALLAYPVESSKPDVPVQLLSDIPSNFFVVQSGLRSNGAVPTHYDQYVADKSQYELKDGQDEITVPFHWQSDNGLKVTKTYHFHRNSYLVEVDYQIENNTGSQVSAYPYSQFNRIRPQKDSGFIYTYTGAVFSSEGNEYDKIKFDDLDDAAFNHKAVDGWAAMIQHYFVAALVPEQNGQENSFYGKSLNDRNYTAGAKMSDINVASGDAATTKYSMYLGPKEHKRLEAVVNNLDLTVDYGILTIISQPLFTIMEWIHKLTNNWGWSIVFLTVLIKLAFYKLSAASYRSMASMRKLTPKLATLKERYGDDKPAFNKAMMDLYRTEKINPLGGCLPILVQMPVFLSFYWVLVESIELRQAPFIFWLQDLTAMDPYFVLPVLFGLSMFFQQKLNPAPQDPAQAMVMKAFPVVFTVFFAFFPSGLVLYWVVNNTLSIAQQWNITRKLGAL